MSRPLMSAPGMDGGKAPTARSAFFTTVGVVAFFAAMFAVPSGYSYAGAILFITGVCLLAGKNRPGLERTDRALLFTLFLYGVVIIGMTLWLGNSHSEVDRATRALLVIPVVLLLLRVPVRLAWLWGSMVVGAVLSAALAWYQAHILQLARTPGFQDAIHFSNVALVYVAFCAAGLRWSCTQGRYKQAWRLALVLGMACGLYSMIAGGSRGSWLALPVIVAVFAAALLTRRNLRYAALVLAACVAAVTILFVMPDSKVHQRYQDAMSDMVQYQQGNADTSIGARLEMWRSAWLNVAQHPILGWNMQAYDQALDSAVQTGQITVVARYFADNLHNNYLQAWAFAGLPGLLVVLALYGLTLCLFGRHLRDRNPAVQALAICGTVLGASYACFSLTHVILGRNNTVMFFLLALSILWGALRHARATAACVQDGSSARMDEPHG